jgi:hypothetical protein
MDDRHEAMRALKSNRQPGKILVAAQTPTGEPVRR